MKVKELIKVLVGLDPNLLVVMSRDAEGNGYGVLRGVGVGMNFEDGEVFFTELTDELIEQGYGEEDVQEGGTPAVVLWP